MKCLHSTTIFGLGATAVLLVAAGCTHSTVDVRPIKVEPMYLTIDINLKVDRELDKFFDFEDKVATPATQPADTTPPSAPVPPTQSSLNPAHTIDEGVLQ